VASWPDTAGAPRLARKPAARSAVSVPGSESLEMTAFRDTQPDIEPWVKDTNACRPGNQARRYRAAFAVLIVLVAAALRWLAHPVLGVHNVFITFYPAVMLAALYGGMVAGLLSAVLSMAIVDYFLIPPFQSFQVAEPADLLSMAVFFGSCTLMSWVAERSARAHRRMRLAEASRRDEVERDVVERTADLSRVTKALKAEMSGRLSLEKRFSKIVEAAPTGIVIVDSLGLIDLVNAAAERAFGYSRSELVGQPVEILLPERFRAHHPRDRAAFLAAPQTRAMGRGQELFGLRKDGNEFPVEIGLSPLTDVEGVKVICTVVDISARKAADQALLESEERLRTATDNAHVGLVVVTREHRYLFANKAYAEILGLPSHDIVGQRVADVLAPMYAEQIEPRLTKAFVGERVVYELTKPATADQAQCFYAVTYEPARSAFGEPIVVVVITDITERTNFTRALAESQRLLLLALDASDLGTWRSDMIEGEGNLQWDARSKAMFGFAPDLQVTFDVWKDTIPSDNWPAIEANLARAMSADDPRDDYVCDYPVRRTDGLLRWIAVEGRAFFEADRAAASGRKPVCIIGTMRDVTEARRAEEERYRATELLRTIIETAPGMIYAKDREGRMVIANAPVLGLFGKPWAELKGRTDLDIMDDTRQAAAVMATDQRIMAAGVTEVVEENVGEEDGQARVWLSTKTPLRNAKGDVVGLVGVSLEITERKRIEDRLRLMVHELNHRVKNTLAIVQAIAGQTLRRAEPSVRQTLEDRLIALAAAHDVLTRETWAGADLNDIVAASLAPYAGGDDGRYQFSGPPLRLVPRAALALSMGLHELATNAVKYGALSTDTGRVKVEWIVRGPSMCLTWSERGGPLVTPPSRRGFGTRLIERSIARDLAGAATISFDPDGVTCVMEAPLSEVASTAEELRLPRVGSQHAR
jgi:PAS domain S-box-containing protein